MMKNKLKDCYKELLEKLDMMETNLSQIQEYVSELKKTHGCAIANIERNEDETIDSERENGTPVTYDITEN